jgi:integral membrane protein
MHAAPLFRYAALAEAVSWIGLLVGMFFKHVTETGELGVTIFGPIHGAVFVAYVAASLLAARKLAWDRRTTFWALLSSIPPLATIVFERWALRTGKLDPIALRRRA